MAGFAHGATAASTNQVFKHELSALLCYFMLGCGFLVSWNSFLTATDFFNSVFPDRSVDRVFTIVYLPLTFTIVGLVARYPRILWAARIRIWTAYGLFTAANAAIPVIDACLLRGRAPDGSSSQAAYNLALAAVALVALADGLSQGTVFGDAALLPPRYTRAVVKGMSASGVAISSLRLITKGALAGVNSGGMRIATQIYFACAASITAACLVLYQFVMPRLDVVRYYRGRLAADQAAGGLSTADVTGKDAAAAGCGSGSFSTILRSTNADDGPSSPANNCPAAASSQHLRVPGVDLESLGPAAGLGSEGDGSPAAADRPSWQRILRLNWRLCLAVMCVYAVTLSIFPGFLAEDVHSQVLKSWYPVLLIFTFNVFDLGGRCLPTMGWCPSQITLLLVALARLALVPLYAISSKIGAKEPVFFVLTSILGATNGWTTALIFMAAPRGLRPSAAELAGMITVFCELAGLNIGAFCGWLWTV